MSDILTDGDFTIATAVSDIRESAPFVQFGIATIYVIDQDFCIARAFYSPLAIDTAHPTLAGYFLAKESPYQPVSINHIVKWTRTYSKVPSNFSRPSGTMPYTFPAMLTGDSTTSRLAPKTMTVNARMQTDFFHTSDPDSITVIQPQRYVLAAHTDTDASSSEFGQPIVTNGAAFTETLPNVGAYKTMVATEIEIVPEASKITPNWMGNIHMRETLYIKAK
jgi:hypothetical protein